MARQRGVIKIDGTIDDLTFYKTSDGYQVRSKGGVSAERIATDPAFARTRENGAEFSRAAQGSKLLRTAFRTQLQNVRGQRTASRLTEELLRVIKTDPTNGRGDRTVMDGETNLLEDFDFNAGAQLGSVLFAPYTATIDKASGAAKVELPAFVPVNEIAAPAGATHFILHATAGAIDFGNEVYEVKSAASGVLELSGVETALQSLQCNLAANSAGVVLLLLGVEFYQQVNDTLYALKDGGYNALTVVRVG